MNCPSCSAQFEFAKSINPKRGALAITCECPECGAKLGNNPNMEIIRAVGILATIFGFLSFGGSWPVPQLPVLAAGSFTIVGLSLAIYGFKNAKFTSQQ